MRCVWKRSRVYAVAVSILLIACISQAFVTQVSAKSVSERHDFVFSFTLPIYGNANEDDTIDMRDVTYIKLVIFGKKPETEFCDANYDGKVSMLDVVQTKLIIVGKEGELKFKDSADRVVTVDMPVKRIIALSGNSASAMRTLKLKDKVVGVSHWVTTQPTYYPEMSKLPGLTSKSYEDIIGLEPDVLICYPGYVEQLAEKLPEDIAVVGMDFHRPDTMCKEMRLSGYIFNRREEAEEFINWYDGILREIKDKCDAIPDDERPKVIYLSYSEWKQTYWTVNITTPTGVILDLLGVKNPARDMFGGLYAPTWPGYVQIDPEWVLEQNPDIIVRPVSSYYGVDCGIDVDEPWSIKQAWENFLSEEAFSGVKAIKNRRLYLINDGECMSDVYPVTTAFLAKWFYPEYFKDLEPEELFQEYFTRFQGLDYDLDEHGVFAYPPILEHEGDIAGIPDKYIGEVDIA